MQSNQGSRLSLVEKYVNRLIYLDLELVLVVGVALAELLELLRLQEAGLQVLRRHKVLRHLDAVMDVADLGEKYEKQITQQGLLGMTYYIMSV